MSKNIEGLLHLSQPEFETGPKTQLGVGTRRAYHTLGTDVRAINVLTAPFLTPELRRIQDNLERQKEIHEHLQPAFDLLNQNIVYMPKQAFLRASPFHCDNWVRDSFYGTLFIDEPDFEAHVLSQFDKADTSGHLPTTRLFPGTRTWAFDDESTMLGLIWRAKLAQSGEPVEANEQSRWRQRWEWVQSHTQFGQYVSPAGTEHSWFDTYHFPRADVNTYTQGIYAATTVAVTRLGLGNGSEIAEAVDGYQQLQHSSGRLQFSRSQPYTDVSSLTGEFLAMALFGEQLLSDSIVLETVYSLPKNSGGIPVVATEDGGYLNPREFNRQYLPGDYHNGGDWPLFNAFAHATAEKHGASHDRVFWQTLIEDLRRSNNAENFYTGDGFIPESHNPTRTRTVWNTGVYKAASIVMSPQDIIQITCERDDDKGDLFYSEASQLPGSSL